jgi:DNA-binding transcriptional MerR regulator
VKVQYTIRDIEKLTGIKAHTLRIWEQRYNFVIPHRTDTNIRFYDDEQLKFLLNVGVLIKHGRKISKVAKMDPEIVAKELLKISGETSDKNTYFHVQIDNLLIAMIDLDEDKFEKVISTCALRYGFEQTMVHLVTPFLGKVGVLWTVGEINISQEHFISHLIRRKLIVALDAFSGKGPRAEKFILYLPEGEYHELGLLFAKYLIKSRGFQVVYLGQSLPFNDLKILSHKYKPDYLLTYFTAGMGKKGLQNYLKSMTEEIYVSKEYIICGPRAKEIAAENLPEKMRFVGSVHELLNLLDGIQNAV